MKLNLRAYISYLIGYNSINIYRIQILYKGIVISTRDIICNKSIFFNGKRTDLLDKLIAKLDILIKQVKLPESQARNKALLKEDEEILELAIGAESDNNNEPIQDFNQDKDLKLAKAIEDAYITLPLLEKDKDSPYAFYVEYPLDRLAIVYYLSPLDYRILF